MFILINWLKYLFIGVNVVFLIDLFIVLKCEINYNIFFLPKLCFIFNFHRKISLDNPHKFNSISILLTSELYKVKMYKSDIYKYDITYIWFKNVRLKVV